MHDVQDRSHNSTVIVVLSSFTNACATISIEREKEISRCWPINFLKEKSKKGKIVNQKKYPRLLAASLFVCDSESGSEVFWLCDEWFLNDYWMDFVVGV